MLWIAAMFFHIVFLFYFFIFQHYICRFSFNIELIESLVLWFFFFKTLLIATVFLRIVFFYDFLRNYLFLFYFLILSWLKITVTICEESTVTFLKNYYWLLQCFFPHSFFMFLLCFFLKLFLSILFFKY
jgi:hypothetical protein